MEQNMDAISVSFDDERGIGKILLNRPDSLNAINRQMHHEIKDALDLLERQDDEVEGIALRVVVIEGAGDTAFCAGADVSEFEETNPAAFDTHTMQDTVIEYPAPIVAKIQGYCLGGGFELALSSDFRLASESSQFGFPERDLGLIPGAGGIQHISRLASPAVAKELAMTGEFISAERAAEEGIINHVYADDEFESAADEFVEQIATAPPLAIRAMKDSGNMASQVSLKEGRKYDRRIFPALQETQDHVEGAKAFNDDEYEPEFTGQ